jgi:hypothetical protein
LFEVIVTVAVCASPAGDDVGRSSEVLAPLLHPASTAAAAPRLIVDMRRERRSDTTSSGGTTII